MTAHDLGVMVTGKTVGSGTETQGKGVLIIYIYRKRVRNSAVSGTSLEMKELCDWLYRGEVSQSIMLAVNLVERLRA